MRVYEIKVKTFLLKNINSKNIQIEICKIIDQALARNEIWLKFHNKNEFKNYCFNSMYPIPKDGIYKSQEIYTFIIRTINAELANYLNGILCNEYNNSLKCLISEMNIIPKRNIEKIYSLTPIIIKNKSGYWRGSLSIDDFENRLKINLIKKYNKVNQIKINEEFDLYTSIEFKNKKPCCIYYKNIKLLGDKISLNISDDFISQEIAYMALGTGLCEFNSRGGGFVNYRWL